MEATAFITSSDERLKKDIVNLTGALSAVESLRGVTYHWKDESKPHEEVGVIAQDVQKHYPQMVHQVGEHLKVDYSRLSAVLIEAVKELASRVKALEAKA